ncbi:MAG: citrate synthase [Actinomycetia bacterium]|nr:citrate synthase [Actinomycetes bacterium]
MNEPLINSRAAAERLGVKVETLYAYVSRGLIDAHQVEGSRGSHFHPADVDALAQRSRGGDKRSALTVTSAVTRIEGGHYWYRGIDPLSLIGSHHFEQVAELLWGSVEWSREDRTWPQSHETARLARATIALLPPLERPISRLTVAMAVIGALDELKHDLDPSAVRATARRMLATLALTLDTAPVETASIAGRLLSALGGEPTGAATAAVDTTLILLADHELAASTMAARTAAAFRSDPHAVVAAGLGALAGVWHGGASGAVETMLADIVGTGSVERALSKRIRDGQPIPGLGQHLYPDGDPRTSTLLATARRAAPNSPVHAAVDELLIVCDERGYPPPNCDLGVATLSNALGLAVGSGEVMFAVSRMAGWIAHAMEEYESPSSLRPRAVYVGPRQSETA